MPPTRSPFLGSSSLKVGRVAWIAMIGLALGLGCGDSSGKAMDADATSDDTAIADSYEAGLPDRGEAASVLGDTADLAVPTPDSPEADSPVVDIPDAAVPLVDSPIADSPADDNPDAIPADDELDADSPDVDYDDAIFPMVDSRDAFDPDSAADSSGDASIDTPPVAWLAPTVSGTVYTYTFGDTIFAVDAAKGGRIVTFSLAGRNILTAAKNSGDNNWGSTLWPSPQSDWNWPPPA
jgi:hypothetical protein